MNNGVFMLLALRVAIAGTALAVLPREHVNIHFDTSREIQSGKVKGIPGEEVSARMRKMIGR
jgi:hypothetical protein